MKANSMNNISVVSIMCAVMSTIIFTVFMAYSCGHAKASPNKPDALKDLDAKAETYLAGLKSHLNSYNFLAGDCDSLLFTSILAATVRKDIDILAARDSSGKWTRSPESECYPNRSASSISKDMILGVIFWAVKTKRLDVLEDLRDYGRAHRWTYGDGPASRTVLSLNLIDLIHEAIAKLKGQEFKGLQHYAQMLETSGYQTHLKVLFILTLGEVRENLPNHLVKELEKAAESNPRNGLFAYAKAKYTDGDYSAAIAALRDETLFPVNSLPTSSNRCTPYLWQRDLGKDWEPCQSENKEHPGVDWLFLYGLLSEV